jgi:hypothetical protein
MWKYQGQTKKGVEVNRYQSLGNYSVNDIGESDPYLVIEGIERSDHIFRI